MMFFQRMATSSWRSLGGLGRDFKEGSWLCGVCVCVCVTVYVVCASVCVCVKLNVSIMLQCIVEHGFLSSLHKENISVFRRIQTV